MWRIWVIIGVLSAPLQPAWAATSCLEYGDVSLRGTLVRHTYAGPPDYQSISKGDRPIVVWVLQLERLICVADPAQRYPTEVTEIEVELALSADQYAQYQHLLGAKVIANGQLIHGGANYQKRLVLTASEIERTGVLP